VTAMNKDGVMSGLSRRYLVVSFICATVYSMIPSHILLMVFPSKVMALCYDVCYELLNSKRTGLLINWIFPYPDSVTVLYTK
jgi:hypothetical protein